MIQFIPDLYPGGTIRARLNDQEIAMYDGGPGPTVLRWYHIKHSAPGYIEHCESVESAQELVRQFVAGLEIALWDAPLDPD